MRLIIAKFIGNKKCHANDHTQLHWFLSDRNDFVITSARDSIYIVETYMFSANAEGKITDYCEIVPGSIKDCVSHIEALKDYGVIAIEDSDGKTHILLPDIHEELNNMFIARPHT